MPLTIIHAQAALVRTPCGACRGSVVIASQLTHKQDKAGPLMELHGVGLAELEHGPGVPGEEPALRVIQHLHAALSRDHVALCVQQNQRGYTCEGKEKKMEGGLFHFCWFVTHTMPSPTERLSVEMMF